MVYLLLGWDLESIIDELRFPTDEVYKAPNLDSEDQILNDWWQDLFQFFERFGSLDVFASNLSMTFFEDDEVYFIGIPVSPGLVQGNADSFHEAESFASAEVEDFTELLSFIENQRLSGFNIPAPKVHISDSFEHDFIHVQTMEYMIIEDKETRQRKAEMRLERSKKGMCTILSCDEKAESEHPCTSCRKFCEEHNKENYCGCKG